MIKFEKVRKIYPDGTEAIKSISFEVKKGEFCVLLGLNFVFSSVLPDVARLLL